MQRMIEIRGRSAVSIQDIDCREREGALLGMQESKTERWMRIMKQHFWQIDEGAGGLKWSLRISCSLPL
jgi:hypothetical protein